MQDRGIDHAVHLGVPGLTGIKALARFAATCGGGALTAVLKKYGVSIDTLIGNTGPGQFIDRLAAKLGLEHGAV